MATISQDTESKSSRPRRRSESEKSQKDSRSRKGKSSRGGGGKYKDDCNGYNNNNCNGEWWGFCTCGNCGCGGNNAQWRNFSWFVFLLPIVLGFFTSLIVHFGCNWGIWYMRLWKPAFNPPMWIYTPIWIILYLLFGFAAAYMLATPCKKPKKPHGCEEGGSDWQDWQRKCNKYQNQLDQKKQVAIAFWFATLIFTIGWSYLFFCFGSIGFAFIDMLIVAILTGFTIYFFCCVNPVSAWILTPFALWILFALILNGDFLRLNGWS